MSLTVDKLFGTVQVAYNYFQFLRIPPFKCEEQVAYVIGLSLSESRLFLTFFLMIAMAVPVQLLKGTIVRELYVLLVGIGLSIYIYAHQTLLIFPPIIVTYCLARFIPKYAGLSSFLFNFGYLLISYSALDSYRNWRKGIIDVTAPIMVLVFKAIAFSWSCQDKVRGRKEMPEYIVEKSDFTFPSFFEFLSYMFNGGNILVGPFNEFKDFQDMMTKRGVWSDKAKPYKMPNQYPAAFNKLLQGFIIVAIYGFLGSYLTNSQMLVFGDYFDRGFASRLYAVTLASFVLRMRYYLVWSLSEVSIIVEGLGYEGWIYKPDPMQVVENNHHLEQANKEATQQAEKSNEVLANIEEKFEDVQAQMKPANSVDFVAGNQIEKVKEEMIAKKLESQEKFNEQLSQNNNNKYKRSYSKQRTFRNEEIDLENVDRSQIYPSFNRYINSDIIDVEFCENSALIARHWNKCTGNFLRFYVYERVKHQKGSTQFVATYATMMVSALWHGLSPGYFIFFGGYSLQVELGRYLYRLERDGPLSKFKGSLLYRLVKSQIVIFGLNTLVPTFTLLSLEQCYRYLNSVFYLPILIPLLFVFLFKMGLFKGLVKKHKSKTS